jgi:hypothetical protein
MQGKFYGLALILFSYRTVLPPLEQSPYGKEKNYHGR